nr:MAG TPA: helix-turn-helix domain protein [Caudoviricetes sp.]
MSDTKIKDMFFTIPLKWVFDNDFKGGEFRLLLYIFSIADNEGGINKTIGMLASAMQEKENVISKYLKQLSELNYISVAPERANSYDLYRKIKILKLFED